MADVVTKQELEAAKIDVKHAGEAVNTKKVITPRYGPAFKSLPLAIQEVIETGGFEPFATEAALLASTPLLPKKAAKALDTKKIWIYESRGGVTKWWDTGLSDKDLSIQYTDQKLKQFQKNEGSASNLFQFEDSHGKTAVVITKEADIRNPNYSLNEIGEATGKSAAKISDQLDKTASTALYEFNDADGNTVIEFSNNGDVKTPNGGLYETIEQQQTIKDKINGQLEANQNKTAFEFDDSQNNTIVEFNENGDIVFNGGRSLIAELEQVNSSSSFKRLSLKESVTDDFISALSQASFNNSGQKSPVFNGAAKQKYTIANTQDFLNIKISEPEPLLIDTPYFKGLSTVKPYSQVVHPYICEFNQTVRGYKYIVLLTPFHNTSDFYENPCVYGSNDLQKMELLTGFEQPLAKAFMNTQYDYNSDNFAVYDHMTGEFCVIYRHAIKQNNVDQAFLKIRKTVDFINWTEFETFKDESGNDLVCGLSPSVVYNPNLNKWMMHSINFYNGTWNLVYQTSDDLINGWSASVGTTKSEDFKFWHQETRYCGGHFITIINDLDSDTAAMDGKGGLHLGISLDGINFEYSEQILETPYHNPYKASISPVLENGELSFNIMWTDNGNVQDGWRLYSVKTNSIEVN